MRHPYLRRSAALLTAGLIVACSGANGPVTTPSVESARSCTVDDLNLVRDNTLTIGTDSPAFPPWFIDDDPSNGKGFESAVAYAVAEGLGFAREAVHWVHVPFNTSYQPGMKDFDFDINQISITQEREQAVDFSDGYYTVNQALVAEADSQLAEATVMSDVRRFKLGAQVGTTSLGYIRNVIQPETEPFIYDTTEDAKVALETGRIDGIVSDLPTAFFISAVEIEGAAVVGQFPPAEETEEFGMLFEEGNPLRDCVNQVLANLKDTGQLAQLEEEWLADATGATVIADQ